jgi:cyclophilin family peptidyl-prolyl cis-trans isomerase
VGKAKKFKEQRKIDKLEAARKKAKRVRLIAWSITGFFLFILFGVGVSYGTKWIKNKYFSGNKSVASVSTYKTGDHKYSKAPDMQIDQNKTYTAKFETSSGNFEVQLNAKDAPKTVNNFVVLAKDGFYNGLAFHRIVKDFMIQGGDPEGTGGGGPGYKFDDEKFTGDYTPGTLAMANSGKNTNGSQFFIMTGDYSNGKLPKDYVIFGKVTSGMDIVNKLAATEVKDNGQGENSKPVKAPVINKITIEEK